MKTLGLNTSFWGKKCAFLHRKKESQYMDILSIHVAPSLYLVSFNLAGAQGK